MGKRGNLRNIMKIMALIRPQNKDDFNLSIVIYSILLDWPLKTASLPLGQVGSRAGVGVCVKGCCPARIIRLH